MRLPDFIRKNKLSFSILLLLFLLPFLFSSGVALMVVRHEDAINQFNPFYWALFYFLACFTMAFALTHTTFIALLSGYFLGWLSLPGIALSYLAASLIGYLAAGRLDKEKFFRSIENNPSAKNIASNLKEKEFNIIFLSRLSPVLPFAMTNFLLSFLQADLKKFMVAGFLGMLPRTILSIWVGTQAHYIRQLLTDTSEEKNYKIMVILLLVVSVSGLVYYITRAIRPRH